MIVNLQRKVKIDVKEFAPFVESLLSAVPESSNGSLSVAFISDRRMKELNRFFRGTDSTTDVLSFPHEPDEFESKSYEFTSETTPSAEAVAIPLKTGAEPPNPEGATSTFLGDIVISVEQAQKQAAENGLTLKNEIKQLILHGLLHLCGYDHETDDGEMDERE